MAKVQHVSDAEFIKLIFLHDVGLQAHAARNDLHQSCWIAEQEALDSAGFELFEKHPGADGSVFDDFSESAPQFAVAEAIEGVEITGHQPRLAEGAHDVFYPAEIDRDFSTDTGVHGGE